MTKDLNVLERRFEPLNFDLIIRSRGAPQKSMTIWVWSCIPSRYGRHPRIVRKVQSFSLKWYPQKWTIGALLRLGLWSFYSQQNIKGAFSNMGHVMATLCVREQRHCCSVCRGRTDRQPLGRSHAWRKKKRKDALQFQRRYPSRSSQCKSRLLDETGRNKAVWMHQLGG